MTRHDLPRHLCVCRHVEAVHTHYREGSECGLCDCPRYIRLRPWREWITGWWRRG